jgi:hypothetical protein
MKQPVMLHLGFQPSKKDMHSRIVRRSVGGLASNRRAMVLADRPQKIQAESVEELIRRLHRKQQEKIPICSR